MDDIGLYKGKLNEALEIVPTMTQEKKLEAVTYWNNVALKFQKIVTTETIHDKSAQSASDTSPGATTTATNSTTTISSANDSPNESEDQHKILDDENLLLTNRPNLNDDQQHSVSSAVATTPSLMEYIGSEHSATTPDDGDLTDTSIKEVMLPATRNKIKVTASTTTSISNELVQGEIPLDPPTLYNNVILSERLGCPRTLADVADEIGNGQFDRGPAKSTGSLAPLSSLSPNSFVSTVSTTSSAIHHHHGINQLHPLFAASITAPACSGVLMLPSYDNHNVNTCTHSDRPLQQIQPFDLSSNNNHQDLLYQGNQNRSHPIMYHNNDYHQQHYASESPVENNNDSATYQQGSLFSSGSETPSPMENISPMDNLDMEQIARVKRELIDESERCENNVSDASISANSVNGSNVDDTADNSNNNNGQQSLHTCDVCGKSGFSTKGNLKRHLKAHSGEKPYKCDFCDSCFTEKKSLKIHVRRHTGEKPYKCDVCGKLFSQTGVLQSHMALHLNERKFECQKCGKAFRQRSQLKLHLMRHEGVKRLKCSTCDAKFLTKGDLERHCRIHTGERPYRCELCKKTFTRQQSLNEHMNRHTGRKPYYCKYCDKTFSEMSACYKHAKTHKRQEQMQQQQQQKQQEQQQQQQQQQLALQIA